MLFKVYRAPLNPDWRLRHSVHVCTKDCTDWPADETSAIHACARRFQLTIWQSTSKTDNSTMGPNDSKMVTGEHIWTYLRDAASDCPDIWPVESHWDEKNYCSFRWPWNDLQRPWNDLEKIFFMHFCNLGKIFTTFPVENKKSALIRFW